MNRIRDIRMQQRMTLVDLAKTVRISPAYLHDIEVGNRAGSPGVMDRIADALMVPVEQLKGSGESA